jgi:hypothetical protein
MSLSGRHKSGVDSHTYSPERSDQISQSTHGSEAFGKTPADSFADASKQERATGQVPDEIGASIKPLFTTTQRAHPPAMSDREFGGNDDLSLPKGKQNATP